MVANTDATQAIVAAILKYGRDVHAPMDIVNRTFETPASSVYWFSRAFQDVSPVEQRQLLEQVPERIARRAEELAEQEGHR